MSKRIIITGNIGTGKSTITKILEEFGFNIISADEINKKILKTKQIEIENLFHIEHTTFHSFKQSLGKLVFENKNKKKTLELFLLPLIYEEIETQSTLYEQKKDCFVSELPTFFENNGLKKYKSIFIINVMTSKEIRISRIMKRNESLSKKDVLNRIEAQIQDVDKIQYSSITIDNSSTYQELRELIVSLLPLFKTFCP